MSDKKENTGKKENHKEPQKGIPIDNEHVSSDPNKSPKGSDKNKAVDQHGEHYVEPYNRKKYQQDPKNNQ